MDSADGPSWTVTTSFPDVVLRILVFLYSWPKFDKEARLQHSHRQSGSQLMHSRQTIFTPFFRWLAAGMVMVFLLAQALCFLHCNFGEGHGESKQASVSCHGPAPKKSCHGDGASSEPSDKNLPAPTGACITLKTFLSNASVLQLSAPELPVLYLLGPAELSLDRAIPEPVEPILRRVWRHDRVFTPEVSLGPAFRSQAPPFLS